MKTKRTMIGIYTGILTIAFCLSTNVSAGTDGSANTLRFRGDDGWSRPGIERSEDNTVITLRFHRAPKDADQKLEALLTENKRTVFTQAELFPSKRGALVRLSLARQADELTRKRYRNKNWLIRVQLETEAPIPAASYASLLPNGLERLAYEESERDLESENPKCAIFDVLQETNTSWSRFALLSLMDCYQTRRNTRQARQIALDIRKDRDSTAIIHTLATLRLSEWPHQKPLRLRATLTEEELLSLPVGIAQEAELRLTRLALRQNQPAKAFESFMSAAKRGEMNARLEASAQELRLRLLLWTAKNNNDEQTLALVDALPLPNLDHMSYPGTARISAMALANAGRADDAAEAAAGIINTEGILIDRKLGRILFHAFTRAGLFEETHWVSHLVDPKDIFFATQAGLEPLSAPSSSILAMWVIKTWDADGPKAAAQFSQAAEGLQDTPGILSEARGAALLGARECKKIMKSSELTKALATFCFLASGDSETARAIWSTATETDESDEWTLAVRDHAVASASFFQELNRVNTPFAGRTN